MTRNGETDGVTNSSRRRFLAGSAAIGSLSLAGCAGLSGDESGGGDASESPVGQIGSGREGRPAPGGTPVAELPDLEGELELYSGRNEFLVGELIEFLDDTYPDFEPNVRYGTSSELVNTIDTEGSGSPADVFYSVNSGSLAALAQMDRTQELSSEIQDTVSEEFRTDQWVGTSGRARTVPFNTDAFEESDIPEDVMTFPDFEGDLGWAPGYGSAQAFVTAMRLLEGEEATREWLEGVVDAGITAESDEFQVAQAVANGELDAGFTNHYYIQRVLDGSSDAAIDTAFTDGDAGSIFNVAGATVLDTASDTDLAQNFVRHLLSAEAQEYFAVETFEYPLIPDVEPVGDLPTIDELDVPEIEFSELGDLEPTIDLMRDVGIDV